LVSRRGKVGIVVVVVIIVGLVGASAAVYYAGQSARNTIPYTPLEPVATIPGAPSEQEVENEIAQVSPDANQDRNWNRLINSCMSYFRHSSNLTEDCYGREMVALRDDTCEIFEHRLLLCNKASALGEKFQSYLNVIG
jgi:hypothetical protein